MAFTGWSDTAVEFFEGLEADNSKAYWTAHKTIYDRDVKAPMEALLAELARDHGEGKIFRPYRDVRFSADKTPYKTNIAATMAGGGYMSFGADGFGVGHGYYQMAKDQLVTFRAAIDDDTTGAELVHLIARLTKTGAEVTAHDSLKTAPRGYAKDHRRIDLLRMKGCIAWQHWDVGPWLATPEPKKRVLAFMKAARPLVDWLDHNVGPSELEGTWG